MDALHGLIRAVFSDTALADAIRGIREATGDEHERWGKLITCTIPHFRQAFLIDEQTPGFRADSRIQFRHNNRNVNGVVVFPRSGFAIGHEWYGTFDSIIALDSVNLGVFIHSIDRRNVERFYVPDLATLPIDVVRSIWGGMVSKSGPRVEYMITSYQQDPDGARRKDLSSW